MWGILKFRFRFALSSKTIPQTFNYFIYLLLLFIYLFYFFCFWICVECLLHHFILPLPRISKLYLKISNRKIYLIFLHYEKLNFTIVHNLKIHSFLHIFKNNTVNEKQNNSKICTLYYINLCSEFILFSK